MNTDVANTIMPAAAAPKNDIWGLVIYCVIIFAIIYFFMIMPNKRRIKEYQKMLDGLKVGNRVLAAGIYGIIKKIGEKTIEIEIAKGVIIEVSKNAIANVE